MVIDIFYFCFDLFWFLLGVFFFLWTTLHTSAAGATAAAVYDTAILKMHYVYYTHVARMCVSVACGVGSTTMLVSINAPKTTNDNNNNTTKVSGITYKFWVA